MKVIALAVVFLSLPSIARTQLASSASLQRIEGTDAGSGAHFVRLLLSLPPSADAPSIPPPRFTVECFDNKGKHDMRWLLSFGGIPDNGFEQPFRASQTALFPPAYPSANLRMVFEGYMKSKPFTRSWSVLPTRELRYRNPGADSPNMDTPRYFLTFLNSLPGLRLSYGKPVKGSPVELFFPTQPLLDELRKNALCEP